MIGAPGDSSGAGAAWVFTRPSTTWTQQGAKLTAKSGEETARASSAPRVALSSGATTALIGGSGDNSEASARRGCFARKGHDLEPSRAQSSPAAVRSAKG